MEALELRILHAVSQRAIILRLTDRWTTTMFASPNQDGKRNTNDCQPEIGKAGHAEEASGRLRRSH